MPQPATHAVELGEQQQPTGLVGRDQLLGRDRLVRDDRGS